VNLIILEPGEASADGGVTLSGARAAHLINVLKAATGKRVQVGVLDGPRGTGEVQSVSEGTVALRCEFEANVPPRPRVDLLLALPRPKVMRRLWAQIAALGVGRIILTNAERVERDYFGAHIVSEDTYRPLLIEGLQQARDTRLPIVSVHKRFRVLIEDELDGLVGSGLRLVADPGASRSVSEALRTSADERTVIAVGPEGGWNAFELDVLDAEGFTSVSMGPRVLRTDTACLALLALAHAAHASRIQR
jgi:16S rRNA (uracil1498-N3)-methyltransferase